MKKSVALLFWIASGVVLAAIVSAADIAAAIQNSPSASTWLKQNAQAVAQLAINVESGGNTSAFNGSCCYGVLQMNRTNIARYANVTPEQYRQLSLQEQVNAWSALTSDALQAAAVRNLLALGTFDGRPVDGNLVLACVQLGIGNKPTGGITRHRGRNAELPYLTLLANGSRASRRSRPQNWRSRG